MPTSIGATLGALTTMVILGAATACVSIPSAAVFLVNKLTRHQTPQTKRGRKLKTRQSGATNQLQSVVGSTASDDEKEKEPFESQLLDQPPAAEERVAETPLPLADEPEDKTLDDSHEGHQDKMEIGEIEPVIDSPEPRQQEPTISELTPEKEKEKVCTMVGEEEGDTSSDNSARDLANLGFAIPLGGCITDYPSLEKVGQQCLSVGHQNVKLVQRTKWSYLQEDTTRRKWQYAHDSEDEVSSSPSSPSAHDECSESEVSSTNQTSKEEEDKSTTQDQPPLSVETNVHTDKKKEENQPDEHDDDAFVSPVSYQSMTEAAQDLTLDNDTIESAVTNYDKISTDNNKKATDDDLEVIMATTMRTLAKMSPTTTTGSLSIVGDVERYLASSSSLSRWYSILKWMQLLFIVMLKVMVVFVLLAVSVKIAEKYEVWP